MTVDDIEHLIHNRDAFNAFVYTPAQIVAAELQARKKDAALTKTVNELLSVPVPSILENTIGAVLVRHIVSPNYEVRRFVTIVEMLPELQPIFFEYSEDKFTSNNEEKTAYGKVGYFKGVDRHGASILEFQSIIDFNTANGKKISQVRTRWGQPLPEFHHELFSQTALSLTPDNFFNISDWFQKSGGSAKEYYTNLLLLFIQHGVLFENFLIDHPSSSFTRDIFLPAFLYCIEKTGLKPLIVELEPTEIEGDRFWMCYPEETKAYIQSKIS